MNVRFTPEAQAQADECDTWWRQHRTARDLFARELAGIKEVLLSNPKLGTVSPSRLLRSRLRGGRDHDSRGVGRSPRGRPEPVAVTALDAEAGEEALV